MALAHLWDKDRMSPGSQLETEGLGPAGWSQKASAWEKFLDATQQVTPFCAGRGQEAGADKPTPPRAWGLQFRWRRGDKPSAIPRGPGVPWHSQCRSGGTSPANVTLPGSWVIIALAAAKVSRDQLQHRLKEGLRSAADYRQRGNSVVTEDLGMDGWMDGRTHARTHALTVGCSSLCSPPLSGRPSPGRCQHAPETGQLHLARSRNA